jgi:lipopolysaccharide export system protein LptC
MSSPTNQAASRALRFAWLSRLLSWLAALVGLGFVGLFLVQAGLFANLLPEPATPPPAVNPNQITAAQSTVNGLDRENQPYTVTAQRGWQDSEKPNLVHLETIDGQFRRASGAEYRLSAATGTYDTDVKTLDLAGGVTIVQPDRFTARMDKAHVVVEEKKLTSGVPVDVTLPSGSVKANGIEITDDGDRILFLNGVKAVFNAAPAPPAKGDAKP